MKKILAAFLVGVLSISMLSTASAAYSAPDDIIVVQDVNGMTKGCSLSVSGTTAYCDSTYADGQSSIRSINGVQTLEKRNASGSYSKVSGASWSETVYSSNLSMFHFQTGLSKGTYRLKTVFKVTFNNGRTETTTVYSTTKTVN